MRPCQPVYVAGGKQQRRHRARDQEIAAECPVEAEPQPDTGSDCGSIEECDAFESEGAVDATHSSIGKPFPGEPGLPAAGERIRIGPWKIAGGQDRFAGPYVPAGIRIPEELFVALEEEQA